jgi:hypothetical protein
VQFLWDILLPHQGSKGMPSGKNNTTKIKENEMKTQVIMITDDDQYHEYKKGDKGYVDGYIRCWNNIPFAVIVINQTEVK